MAGGLYSLPPYLSPGARHILKSMLVVDANKRITIPEIRRLEWFNVDLPEYLKPHSLPLIEERRRGSAGSVDPDGQPIAASVDGAKVPNGQSPSSASAAAEEGESATSVSGTDGESSSNRPGRAWIEGVGIVDQDVVEYLCKMIEGLTSEEVWNNLTSGHDKDMRIAYQLARDNLRMKHGSHLDDREALATFQLQGENIEPSSLAKMGSVRDRPVGATLHVTAPGGAGGTTTGAGMLNQPLDEPEVSASHIRILSSSIPYDDARTIRDSMRGQTSPLKTTNRPLTPAEPTFDEKARAQSPAAAAAAAAAAGRGGVVPPKPKKIPRTKWHFGIRSKSPPMTVMLEIYRTLASLGFEFKRKLADDEEDEVGMVGSGVAAPGSNGGNGNGANGKKDERTGEKDKNESDRKKQKRLQEEAQKKAQELYFVETRIRMDDVMVRSTRWEISFARC